MARVELVAGSIPVLYIEDFYADPYMVREEGLRASFDRSGALYPGRHARLETAAAKQVVQHVCRLLTTLGDRVYDAASTITDFSILTTRARDLIGPQKHPHVDPTPVLGLVYLNPHSTQGTCFFKNRILNKHTVVGDDELAALATFLKDSGPTFEPNSYAVNDNGAWEKIYTIEGVFNRIVIYPGNVFHSIDVDDIPENFDIITARLTQRIIVQQTFPKP